MALRDDDKVMAGLLRRTLASSSKSGAAPGADDCPPADLLAAYYEHSLESDESARYELHFSQCAFCREQLAVMARAEEIPQPRPNANWAWLWNPYWLAPALAVLTLAIFFGVRHSIRITATAVTGQSENAPLVAMSRPDQVSPQEPATPPPPPPAAARNAPANELQQAQLDSIQRDSLAKEKQAPLRESPAPQSAPLAYSAPSPLPASPAPSDKKAQDVPLNNQGVDQLQTLRKSETEQKDTGAPQSSNQNVNVTATAPQIRAAQNAASPRQESAPAPPALGGVAGAGAVPPAGSGATAAPAVQTDQNAEAARQESAPPRSNTAGALGGAAGTRAKTNASTAGNTQTQSFGAISSLGAGAKSPVPQVAAEISAHKVFQSPNTNVLWRSADGGFVERSPDGGATWEGQLLPGISGEIAAGSSPAPKICWLVGSAGTIYMTKDATNWNKIAAPVSADFTAVTAKDASNATVTAADGRGFQTTDGGKHWKPVP